MEDARSFTSATRSMALGLAGAAALPLAGCDSSPTPSTVVARPAPSLVVEDVRGTAPTPSPTPDRRVQPEPASTALTLASLAGAWRVIAVHVGTDGVQALSEDDPADMGAVLDIAPDRLAWRPREGGGFEDVCTTPRLASDGRVTCGDGAFGPPDTQLAMAGDRIAFDWYDGARLVLERVTQ